MSFSNKKFSKAPFKPRSIAFFVISLALVAAVSYAFLSKKSDEKKSAEGEEQKLEIVSSGLDKDKKVKDVEGVEEVIAKWIEANPKAIINSVTNMQKKAMEEQLKNAQKNIGEKKDELFNDKNSPQHAPSGYDVTIVEFFDYSCGYCKKAAATVEEVLKDDSKVRLIYKEFPILGAPSREMSQVSVAVNLVEPSSFKKFHDALMRSNEKGKSGALKIAKSVGISSAKIEDALKTKKEQIDKEIEASLALGSSIGINGTPGFVVGEELVPGALELGAFKEKISALRAKK